MRARIARLAVVLATCSVPAGLWAQGAIADHDGAEPDAQFEFSPASPQSGDEVTFTSRSTVPDGRMIAREEWDLNGDNVYDKTGRTVTQTFAAPGQYTVRLKVTDDRGESDTKARTVTVAEPANRPPTADFFYDPTSPRTLEAVTFTSRSSDPEGAVTEQWDLNGDGVYGDATGRTVSRNFARPGEYTVGLRVVDAHGAAASTSHSVTVENRAPSAGFEFSPARPHAGEPVNLRSTATDADGVIAAEEWDLDGDGAFDDARGNTVTHSFPQEGSHTVSLRATDDRGATSPVSFKTIEVAAAPPPPPREPSPPPAQPTPPGGSGAGHAAPRSAHQFLTPFPIVRLTGRLTGAGVRIGALTVQAPAASKIEVRCRGRGCPFGKRMTSSPSSRPFGMTRIRSLAGRRLAAGSLVEVLVRKPGLVGKYTRFRVRRAKPPLRLDAFLPPGSDRPTRAL